MSKRKAIEAALSRWNKVRKDSRFTTVDTENVIVGAAVEKAYEAGRIAGLREAAAMVPKRGTLNGWSWVSPTLNRVAEDISDRANARAKKARAAK